ncbi:hypothetical protein CUMW_263080 [Citrus unshiu]|uniref:Uncharacterized protein n=1 Tax=Citrus unshiu TaxID=55188 RepID=A0A2H5QUQ4_CITUN|nr:hypothetical protein CUMW_263080 [Citrus unshiu]
MELEKYKRAARTILTPKVGYGLADELKRVGFWVRTVLDKPQAADRIADTCFSWSDILMGKARKEAISVVCKWKDRDSRYVDRGFVGFRKLKDWLAASCSGLKLHYK